MNEKFIVKSQNRRHIDFDDLENEETKTWSRPFYFVQAADCQFGLIDRYIKKLEKPGWADETERSEKFVAACNRMVPKPRFVVVCGDLVDAYPSDGSREDQTKEFKRIFSRLDPSIPLVCVCGNHDIGNQPSIEDVQYYRKDFGDDYFHFAIDGVLFIVINSQFYEDRQQVEEYANNQDEWLDTMLTKCKQYKHSIVFQHIPWFIQNWQEDKQYFNIEPNSRQKWLEKFKQAGVSKIMCGHYHQNAGGWYQDLELVVTSAIGAQLGSDKSGARIAKVLENEISHQYYAIEDLPSRIDI